MLQRIEGETGVPVSGEGVFFRMRNGQRTVRFFASSGLLEALSHGPATDERAAFLAFRRDIEILADERWEHRPFDDDSIIWITEHALPCATFQPAMRPPTCQPCYA